MNLDIFWTKLLFLVIPLSINANGAENFQDSIDPGSPDASWFKNWRRPHTTPYVEQGKIIDLLSTTPLTHPLQIDQGNADPQKKSLAGLSNSNLYKSAPKPSQVAAALNMEPMLAIQPRVLRSSMSKERKRDTRDVDVKPVSENPQASPSAEPTVPDLTSPKPSYTKVEELSMPLSINRSTNYYQIEPLGDASTSSPEFISYSLSPTWSKPTLLSSQSYGYSCVTSKGYYKFGDSCDQFVECKQYVASLFKCPPGLQFNQNADYGENPCALSSIIRCEESVKPNKEQAFSALLISNHLTDFVCPTSNGYYRLESDCEKFIKCKQSLPSSYKCMDGLQFNPNAMWNEDPCANSSLIRCKAIVIQPPPRKFSAIIISNRITDFVCPSSEGYYKFGNDCEKFIKCDQSIASSYQCLPSLQFNKHASWHEDPCAPSSVIQCKSVVIQPKFSAQLVLTQYAFNCPAGYGYFKKHKNCEEFIKCEQFSASLYKCLPGLEFNSKAAVNEEPCAIPAIARCEREFEIKPKSLALLIDPSLEDYRCTQANGYFGIDNNCESFVECQAFIPSLYMCPNGFLFNRGAVWGEDPCSSSIHCEIKSTPPLIEQPTPKKSYTIVLKQVPGYFCSVANGYFRVKDKCDHFIRCKKNVPTLNICDFGLHFYRNATWESDPCIDPSVAHCHLSSNSLKRPPMPVEPVTTVGHCPRSRGYFPLDHTECSKYIRCEYGRAIIMPCPPGLVFNAELEVCDWPVNVPSCNPEVFRGFTCPEMNDDGKILKFRYEQSCSKFIACQAGRPRLLSCDFGLSFSLESQMCVRRDHVADCKD